MAIIQKSSMRVPIAEGTPTFSWSWDAHSSTGMYGIDVAAGMTASGKAQRVQLKLTQAEALSFAHNLAFHVTRTQDRWTDKPGSPWAELRRLADHLEGVKK
jgi:hypothetical protein